MKNIPELWVTVGFKIPYSQKITLLQRASDLGYATLSDYLRHCVLDVPYGYKEQFQPKSKALKEINPKNITMEGNEEELLSGDAIASIIQKRIKQQREFAEATAGVVTLGALLLIIF